MSFSGSSLARRHEVIGSVSVLGTCSVFWLQVSSGTMVPVGSLAEIVVVVVVVALGIVWKVGVVVGADE